MQFFESSLEPGVDVLFLKIQTRHWSRKLFAAGPYKTQVPGYNLRYESMGIWIYSTDARRPEGADRRSYPKFTPY
ncbi:hypothetical protein ACQRIT_007119 [Beauveria bassiana]